MMAALDDPRFRLLVLINQDVFVWGRTGFLIDIKNRFRAPRSSEAIGEGADASEQVMRTELVHRRGLASRFRRVLVGTIAALDRATGRGFPARAARTLSARGNRTLFVAGDQDAALHLLHAYFGRDARQLRKLPGMSVTVLKGLDHTLGSHASREMALPVIEQYLLRQMDEMGLLATEHACGAAPMAEHFPEDASHAPSPASTRAA